MAFTEGLSSLKQFGALRSIFESAVPDFAAARRLLSGCYSALVDSALLSDLQGDGGIAKAFAEMDMNGDGEISCGRHMQAQTQTNKQAAFAVTAACTR